jgi:hypothetical protein
MLLLVFLVVALARDPFKAIRGLPSFGYRAPSVAQTLQKALDSRPKFDSSNWGGKALQGYGRASSFIPGRNGGLSDFVQKSQKKRRSDSESGRKKRRSDYESGKRSESGRKKRRSDYESGKRSESGRKKRRSEYESGKRSESGRKRRSERKSAKDAIDEMTNAYERLKNGDKAFDVAADKVTDEIAKRAKFPTSARGRALVAFNDGLQVWLDSWFCVYCFFSVATETWRAGGTDWCDAGSCRRHARQLCQGSLWIHSENAEGVRNFYCLFVI